MMTYLSKSWTLDISNNQLTHSDPHLYLANNAFVQRPDARYAKIMEKILDLGLELELVWVQDPQNRLVISCGATIEPYIWT